MRSHPAGGPDCARLRLCLTGVSGERRIFDHVVASMCSLSRKTIYLARRGIMSERTRAVPFTVIPWIAR